jgi:hypothetical protein
MWIWMLRKEEGWVAGLFDPCEGKGTSRMLAHRSQKCRTSSPQGMMKRESSEGE